MQWWSVINSPHYHWKPSVDCLNEAISPKIWIKSKLMKINDIYLKNNDIYCFTFKAYCEAILSINFSLYQLKVHNWLENF